MGVDDDGCIVGLQQRVRQLEHRSVPLWPLSASVTSLAQQLSSFQKAALADCQGLQSLADCIARPPGDDDGDVAGHAPDVKRRTLVRTRRQVDQARRLSAALQAQIDAARTALVVPVEDYAELDRQFHMQVRHVEQRLERQHLLFAAIDIRNRELRAQLDHDRVGSEADHCIVADLERSLQKRRLDLANAVRVCQERCDARERQHDLYRRMRADSDRQVLAFERQWWSITNLVQLSSAAMGQHLDDGIAAGRQPDDEFDRNVAVLAGIDRRARWAIACDAACRIACERQVRSIKGAIRKIVDGVGLDDINAVIERFVQHEHRAVQDWADLSHMGTYGTMDEGHVPVRDHVEREPPGRLAQTLTSLEARVARVEQETADLEHSAQDVERTMAQAIEKLQAIVDMFGAEVSGVAAGRPTSLTVTPGNIDEAVDCIERLAWRLMATIHCTTNPDHKMRLVPPPPPPDRGTGSRTSALP
ncbi:Uncharacterized protein PBTT_01639 [Plasmodiophora brassicae]|uniref:Uncharacterized protein n=1 Tax=Plasmodiophora brassicae TaxID=37360 RepID=A0A0G4IIY8_PLABS|nr:hypothetical protein PBRA_003858 [Plasmodiophora brassicae]SPQ94371.1 unnamed protein product [Plasmodiophora brassicae]